MKQKTLAQFSLTVICTMVLAACGSSGSNSKPATQSTNNTPAATTPAPTTTTAPTTPATTANDTPKVEDKVETPATNTTPVLAGDGDHTVATVAPAAGASLKGSKTVNRQDSNFQFLEQGAEDKYSHTETMQVQKPDPRFDTLTVAETNGKTTGNKAVVYLEDLDIRGKAATGTATLEKIYAGDKSTNGTDRGFTSRTKTAQQGAETGNGFTYHEGRVNYTNNDNINGKFAYNSKIATSTDGGKTYTVAEAEKDKSDVRELKDSVFEVYGHRTQLTETTDVAGVNAIYADKTKGDDATANLPLVKTVNADAVDTLKNVQYGRVTSSLSHKTLDDFKNGVTLAGKLESYVGTYGKYGNEKTENHYFYRGVENTPVADLTALKDAGKVLSYVGHAVTYGLDHTKHGFDTGEVNAAPTAVSAFEAPNHALISGTHVSATIDMGQGQVTGRAFNNWYNDITKKAEAVELVKFDGTMNMTNGNIAGTATNRLVNGALQDGLFTANVFGKDAAELGGSAHSVEKGEKAWGLVFGATKLPEPPAPPAPKPEKPGLTNSTNANK